MTLRLFIALLLTVLLHTAQAQVDTITDVVYLKNTSKLKGYALRVDSSVFKLTLSNGNTMELPKAKISKIIRHISANGRHKHSLLYSTRAPLYRHDHMYFGMLQLSLGGVNGIRIINGYKLNHWAHIGLGVGIESDLFMLVSQHTYISGSLQQMAPIFAYYACDFLKKKFTPYGSVHAGYSFNVMPHQEVQDRYNYGISNMPGGPIAGVEIGGRIYAAMHSTSFSFALTADWQNCSYSYNGHNYDIGTPTREIHEKANINMLTFGLRLGVGF
jgi:hypothetical protein